MQSLGVPNKAVASRQEMLGEISENLFLSGSVEVDDHVAAEDHVYLLSHPIVGILEIQAAELNELAQLRHNPEKIRTAIAAAHKVPSTQIG